MMRLAIVGAAGRMGQAMTAGLSAIEYFSVVALVDIHEPRERSDASWYRSLADLDASSIDAVVEFSSPDSALVSATWCAAHQKRLVIGTTGLGDAHLEALRTAGASTPVIWATNFSVGAVLSERFAEQAAPYFERVEIIELHHDKKVDAPSGTSLTSARRIASARAKAGLAPLVDPSDRIMVDGARGADAVDGVKIHSVRLPGLVAHQEVLFGGPGEGLTIRHDSYDRASFVQGVALALRAQASPGFIEGIDGFIA
jgi:4-hydroxy-tetrahydrodipicolinate reductase